MNRHFAGVAMSICAAAISISAHRRLVTLKRGFDFREIKPCQRVPANPEVQDATAIVMPATKCTVALDLQQQNVFKRLHGYYYVNAGGNVVGV